MIKTIWLIKQSILLDYEFLLLSNYGLAKKGIFLVQKYFLIVKHLFITFSLGNNYITFNGKNIFYDSCYGFAGYQRQLVSNSKFITLTKMKNIKTVVDVGANVGYFSLMIKNFYPKANIFCFEPIPKTYSCLYNNFINDKSVKTFNSAVGSEVGNKRMSFSESSNALSQITKGGEVKVTTTTLDTLIKEQKISSIDILKIDTEGYESHVLEGAKKTLALTKYLLIEVSLTKNIEYSLSYLMSLLYSKEFEYQLIYFRNLDNVAEGKTHSFDFLMINKKLT
ncbi:MAG: FkbM family methyltransferase [Candidatus Roizmanbacteria bacterium]|nr:FkbM family methyltransferase [Candidatus Roizmanbacteria bacterium]